MLKKETRILGLSAPRKTRLKPIIGTIFRGSLWLDAIVTYLPDGSSDSYIPRLAAALKRTKQYSQIQAAIFSREDILERKYQDYRKLSKLIEFPVFTITKRPLRRPRDEFAKILRNKERISLWIDDYDPQRASELYILGCTKDQSIPEAVRVAELIATELQQSPTSRAPVAYRRNG